MSIQTEKRARSLVATLTTAFAALSAVALLVAGVSQVFFNLQAQQETIAGRQQLIAQEAANAVAGFVQEKFGELETVVKVGNLGLASRQDQRDALGNLLGLDPAFRQVVLLDPQERELVALSRLSQTSAEELVARAGSDLFSQVKQGNRYISPVYVDDVTSEPMVIVAVPVRDVFGGFQGTLLAEVNLKFMWDLVDRLQVGKTGLAYVVDRQGNLLAFRDISRVLRGENVRHLKKVAEFVNGVTPVDATAVDISTGINGDLTATAYVPLGTPDWAVVIELPVAEAYGPVIRSTAIAVLILLVVVALAGLAGVYSARRLAAPVLALTDVATRIAGGEMNLQASPAGPAEVISLAGAFNDMTARLRELIASLELRTRELEASQRVTFAASERVTPDELLDLVVNLVRDQFNLYHAQVYIVDREQGAAVLRQSTGYAGRQLLQRRHKIPLDATALVTKAIHTGEPVLVADVTQDPNFMPNPLLPETKSELVVPLKLGDEIIGVLDAQDRVPGRFGASTVALFQSMADQIAILFENSRLLERITEQTEALTIFTNQLRTAAEIARRLGTVLDPQQLLEQTVELLQSRFGLYHAHIYMVDETTRRLVMQAGSGEVGRVLRRRGHAIPLDVEKSLVARAAREQVTVLVNDTSQDPDFLPNPLLPQTRSEVAIPLVIGDKTLGVLDVQDDQANRFTQADVDTFTTLAGQIATTLQTAGLFEQTRLRLQISRALASARTEEQVLDVLAEQSGLYPQVGVDLMTLEQESGVPTLVSRRSSSFDSGIPQTPAGTRFPASQFPLVSLITPDRSFVSPDVFHDERVDENTRALAGQEGWTSMAIIPITAGDNWLGVLIAVSKQAGCFDANKLALYQTLAEQGAMALRIARLNDEVQRSLAETQMRFAVSQALAGAQTEEQVLDAMIKAADFYPHVVASLFTFAQDEEEPTLIVRRIETFGTEMPIPITPGMRFPASAFPLSQYVTADQAFVSSNVRTDERVDAATREMLGQMGAVAIAVMPITASGQWLGVLSLSSKQEGYFDEGKLYLYQSLAEQGATALHIARLHEETQKTAERLAEVDRLKSEFLASMSHELRTPLNSIIGYTEIMLMGIDAELDPELREDVQAIYDNGKHLLNIINDVLDLAKIEAGRLTLNMEQVPLQSVVDTAASSVTGLLANKPIEFVVEASENLPAIWGDPVRLNQILNNLLSNAVKFTDEGRITLRAFTQDGWACLEVEDTGIGISEADQKKLFERFQQIDSSNARKREGTGLGLAITRHLVTLHGGTIGVKSQVGKGSTFTVRLPLDGQATGDTTSAPAQPAASTMNEPATPAVRTTPARAGQSVVESEGLEEALAEAARSAPSSIEEAALIKALTT